MRMDIEDTLELPEGVKANYEGRTLTVSGENGEVERELYRPRVQISTTDDGIRFFAKDGTQREKRHLFTLKAHARNMVKGASEGHIYKLKICSGHFPMNVSMSGDKFVVKNFLGEAVPRELVLKKNVDVKIDGDQITVTSSIKDMAGQFAADIEQLTRITGRDRRIFQDGIYITEKDGKVL